MSATQSKILFYHISLPSPGWKYMPTGFYISENTLICVKYFRYASACEKVVSGSLTGI